MRSKRPLPPCRQACTEGCLQVLSQLCVTHAAECGGVLGWCVGDAEGLLPSRCKQGATDGVLHALARHLTCLDTLDLTGCTQVRACCSHALARAAWEFPPLMHAGAVGCTKT